MYVYLNLKVMHVYSFSRVMHSLVLFYSFLKELRDK